MGFSEYYNSNNHSNKVNVTLSLIFSNFDTDLIGNVMRIDGLYKILTQLPLDEHSLGYLISLIGLMKGWVSITS